MNLRQIILLAALVLAGGRPMAARAEQKGAEAKPAEEDEQIIEAVDCEHDKDVRRLEAHTKQAGCVLQYHKFGKSSEIAQAKRGVEICKGHLKKVREKLEASGYKCK